MIVSMSNYATLTMALCRSVVAYRTMNCFALDYVSGLDPDAMHPIDVAVIAGIVAEPNDGAVTLNAVSVGIAAVVERQPH